MTRSRMDTTSESLAAELTNAAGLLRAQHAVETAKGRLVAAYTRLYSAQEKVRNAEQKLNMATVALVETEKNGT